LVRIEACGLCNGTDLKIIDNAVDFHEVHYPTVLGHEQAGTIVEVGSKVKNYSIGRKFINPRPKLPEGTDIARSFGGMMELGVVQDRTVMYELGLADSPDQPASVCEIPSGFSSVDAGVILTLKENYSCLDNFGFQPRMDVLLYGDGPVGLGVAKFLRIRDAGRIVCIGHHDDRLRRIESLVQIDGVVNSAEVEVTDALSDQRFDLVIDAVGSTAVIREGAQFLKPGGTVGVYGVIKKGYDAFNLYDLPNHTNLHMLTLPYREHAYHEEIVRLIEDGTIDPKDYYSHTLPAEEINRAIEMTRSREALKVILTF
jgi:threonine dehydrogenase-like Zn-dependent dehydrogenase